ncbi:MAG: hypothetical protein R3F11_24585 [Verrucomicrobiales bacterium]
MTVNLLGDLTDEVNEQFFVSIYNPSSNATIADDRGVGIIYDDDAPVRAVIHRGALNNHSTAVPEGDGGYTPVTLTISLIDPVNPLLLRDSEKTVTVNISAARGTATPEFSDDLSDPLLYGDYAEFATRDDFDNSEDLTNIVFLPGQTSKDITVYVKGDVFAEDGDPTVASPTKRILLRQFDRRGKRRIRAEPLHHRDRRRRCHQRLRWGRRLRRGARIDQLRSRRGRRQCDHQHRPHRGHRTRRGRRLDLR